MAKLILKIEARELDNFIKNLESGGMTKDLPRVAMAGAKQFVHWAQVFTPIVTGQMHDRWKSDNQAMTVNKVGNSYVTTVVNNAAKTTKSGTTYTYAKEVDEGHASYNQFGGPYTVTHSKYGNNGGAVIGLFITQDAAREMQVELERVVGKQLQKSLNWCVNNGK